MPVEISKGDWLRAATLFFAVFLAYQAVWQAGFVWDDDSLVTANPCIIGPLGLREIWTTSAADICPLTLTTFWIEHALWGLRPLPFHLVNIVMQGGCALLLWRVLQNLKIRGAWLGALLWALHPVQAESVAWISELKNIQSGLFYLLTILFFLKAVDLGGMSGSRLYYVASLVCAALAMASKSSTVILPVVLALLAWWKLGRFTRWDALRIAPFMVLALITSAVTLWTERMQEHEVAYALVPVSGLERLALAGYALWFYLFKLLWPDRLSLIYPRWTVDPGQIVSYLPLMAWVLVLVFLWCKRGTFTKGPFVAAAYFTVALLPVLGIAHQTFSRFSYVADHFQYLADMGPLALVGSGLATVPSSISVEKRWGAIIPIGGLFLFLGLLTWLRSTAFLSSEALWSDTIDNNPNCAVAYDNLGWLRAQSGQIDDAIALYRKALEIDPRWFGARYNLANILLQQGQVEQAISEYSEALKVRPDDFRTHTNLGVALLQAGKVDEAIVEYKEALRLKPNDPLAKENLARLQSLAP